MSQKKTVWLVVALLLAAGSTAAYESESYADPLPLGDYVEDVQGLIERSFRRHGWQLQPQSVDTTYIGFISHKGFDITIAIHAQDQALSLTLQSVHETGCSGDCPDLGEERVIGWLVNLRRTIAYELTLMIQQHLADQL